MAGLIQQNMGPAQPEEEAQEGEQPMVGGQGPAEEAAEGSDESDPGYAQAMAFAMEALYRTLRSASDPSEAMADTAYNIVSIVDEKTGGAVPDELLALFASRILEEVAAIADAAGVKVQPSDIALALKQMILRFLGEQGMDTTQLEQAMNQVDPAEFNRLAQEA
jgi:histone H3/H4